MLLGLLVTLLMIPIPKEYYGQCIDNPMAHVTYDEVRQDGYVLSLNIHCDGILMDWELISDLEPGTGRVSNHREWNGRLPTKAKQHRTKEEKKLALQPAVAEPNYLAPPEPARYMDLEPVRVFMPNSIPGPGGLDYPVIAGLIDDANSGPLMWMLSSKELINGYVEVPVGSFAGPYPDIAWMHAGHVSLYHRTITTADWLITARDIGAQLGDLHVTQPEIFGPSVFEVSKHEYPFERDIFTEATELSQTWEDLAEHDSTAKKVWPRLRQFFKLPMIALGPVGMLLDIEGFAQETGQSDIDSLDQPQLGQVDWVAEPDALDFQQLLDAEADIAEMTASLDDIFTAIDEQLWSDALKEASEYKEGQPGNWYDPLISYALTSVELNNTELDLTTAQRNAMIIALSEIAEKSPETVKTQPELIFRGINVDALISVGVNEVMVFAEDGPAQMERQAAIKVLKTSGTAVTAENILDVIRKNSEAYQKLLEAEYIKHGLTPPQSSAPQPAQHGLNQLDIVELVNVQMVPILKTYGDLLDSEAIDAIERSIQDFIAAHPDESYDSLAKAIKDNDLLYADIIEAELYDARRERAIDQLEAMGAPVTERQINTIMHLQTTGQIPGGITDADFSSLQLEHLDAMSSIVDGLDFRENIGGWNDSNWQSSPPNLFDGLNDGWNWDNSFNAANMV